MIHIYICDVLCCAVRLSSSSVLLQEASVPDVFETEADLMEKSMDALNTGEEQDPIMKLRLLCLSRGATGIIGLSRQFRNMDDDGSKTLNLEEFIKGMEESGLDCTADEIKEMFSK